MDRMTVLVSVMSCLLCSTYIITGFAKVNTSRLWMTVLNVLSIAGVACVLLYITVYLAKIILFLTPETAVPPMMR